MFPGGLPPAPSRSQSPLLPFSPLAQYLSVRAASAALDELARRAQKRIVLISPYVQFPPTLEPAFRQAAKRGVEIVIVCKEEKLSAGERDRVLGLGKVDLRFHDTSHAKCYCNENELVIGSLNLYRHSEQNNFEMSVRLSRESDTEAFGDAMRDVEDILEHARKHRAFSLGRAFLRALPARAPHEGVRGHCIRCAKSTAYAPTAPLCLPCYNSWAAWGNEEYQESFCHRCGKERATSKARPLCYDCFSAHPF
jgi:phosphatidylserine/phosphatidylglycerophosphate/cardiolipin synthase-like enzyme